MRIQFLFAIGLSNNLLASSTTVAVRGLLALLIGDVFYPLTSLQGNILVEECCSPTLSPWEDGGSSVYTERGLDSVCTA